MSIHERKTVLLYSDLLSLRYCNVWTASERASGTAFLKRKSRILSSSKLSKQMISSGNSFTGPRLIKGITASKRKQLQCRKRITKLQIGLNGDLPSIGRSHLRHVVVLLDEQVLQQADADPRVPDVTHTCDAVRPVRERVSAVHELPPLAGAQGAGFLGVLAVNCGTIPAGKQMICGLILG